MRWLGLRLAWIYLNPHQFTLVYMTPAIHIQNLHKQYGRLHALKGIDLTIARGEFFGLLGPNGAGKSTLINLLAGLMRPTQGSLSVMGFDVQNDYRQARQNLGVVPQELVFDPFFKVREMLRFQSGYFGLGRENYAWIDEIIESLGLADKANTNMRRLSGGMKRRALIAQALVHRPPVIVLDEPTAGVDVELRQTMWAFIQRLNREGHTIILTTHYLEEAEALCNRIAMLKAGEIIALDSTANLLQKAHDKVLDVLLTQPLPAALQAKVKQANGLRYHLTLENAGELEHILAQLRQAGVGVQEFRLQQADLEDVFVNLMADQSAKQVAAA